VRLRVAVTDAERAAAGARVFLDDALAADLEAWIRRHYRDRIAPDDLTWRCSTNRAALTSSRVSWSCRRSIRSSYDNVDVDYPGSSSVGWR
jgi:succinylarginine dihydrolase